jgi:hypothetical protein
VARFSLARILASSRGLAAWPSELRIAISVRCCGVKYEYGTECSVHFGQKMRGSIQAVHFGYFGYSYLSTSVRPLRF